MELKEVVFKRKSTRNYIMEDVDEVLLNKIKDYSTHLKRLDISIATECVLLEPSEVMNFLPWRAPHYIAIYSEEKEGYQTNAGFMLAQLDLFIQSQGLGCCWVGLVKTSKPSPSNLKCVILLAFGKAEGNNLRSLEEFNRKPMNEICDFFDEKLESARLAPSSINSQPWYFTHQDDTYHVYCANPTLIKGIALKEFNKMDIGCALANLYTCNADTFTYFKCEDVKKINKYYYVGSFKL